MNAGLLSGLLQPLIDFHRATSRSRSAWRPKFGRLKSFAANMPII